MTTQEERLLKAIFRPQPGGNATIRLWQYSERFPHTVRGRLADGLATLIDEAGRRWVQRPGLPKGRKS